MLPRSMPGSFARVVTDSPAKNSAYDRMEKAGYHTEIVANEEKARANEEVAERFERLGNNEEVERLLLSNKERRALDP